MIPSPPDKHDDVFRDSVRCWPLCLAGVIITLFMTSVSLWQPGFLKFLDNRIYDTFMTASSSTPPTGEVIVVEIDEAALDRHGQWPWPRYRFARLLDRLRELGILAAGIDITFPEPDRTSLDLLLPEIARDLGVTPTLTGIPPGLQSNDTRLAEALSRGPFVLGHIFTFGTSTGPSETCLKNPPLIAVRLPEGQDDSGLFQPSGVVCNLPVLDAAAPAAGFFNFAPDSDGVLRRIPLLMEYRGTLHPSLALATYLLADPGPPPVLTAGSDGPESLTVGAKKIPLDRDGSMLLNFRGPARTIRHISAADILSGAVQPGDVSSRIAFIGATAAGLMDMRSTPTDPIYAGVEAHATALDNILRGDFISRPAWTRATETGLVLLTGLFASILLAKAHALWSAGTFLAFSGLLWIAASRLFEDGTFLSPAGPTLTFAVVFAFLASLRYWREERRLRERTRQLMLTQEATIEAIANVTETRDPETGGHIKRTQHYVRALAEHMRRHPLYRDELDDDGYIHLLFLSAPLHDLGKVGVPDHILLKPGRLDPREAEEMMRHPYYGKRILEQTEDKLGPNSFLRVAKEVAYSHQEKWDGTGYPEGLRGQQIPLSGRLMAIADVYDALISRRPYKAPLSHEEAVGIMAEGRGTHFDPDLLDGFLEIEGAFLRIAVQFSDPDGMTASGGKDSGMRKGEVLSVPDTE